MESVFIVREILAFAWMTNVNSARRIDRKSEACLIASYEITSCRFDFYYSNRFDDHFGAGKRGSPAARTGKTAKKAMCADYAKLNLSAEQKTKLTALQEKCMKDGCTEESRAKFLKSAKRILSADQYAQLKAECAKLEKKQS